MTKVSFTDRMPQGERAYDGLQVIGTHNGTFHCDEALAVFLLRQTGTYRDSGEFLCFLAS
jgi:hypothetical protein